MMYALRIGLALMALLLWASPWSPHAAETAQSETAQPGAAQFETSAGITSPEIPAAPAESPLDPAAESPRQARDWDVLFYGGKFVKTTFRRILFRAETDYVPSYVWVAGLNYKLGQLVGPITLETEGQVARHTGIQDNWEINALIIARREWVWRNAFSFSVALGDGFSLASDVPKLEKKENPSTNVFLQALLAEVVFGLPSISWHPRFMIRIHHRSGTFGLLCPDTCGSNFVTYGFKAAF